MTELAARPARGPVPVIVAGDPSLSLGPGLNFTGYGASSSPVRVKRIDTATEFPGQNGGTPLLVMTRPISTDWIPTRQPDVGARVGERCARQLGRRTYRVPIVVSSDSVLDQTSFASIGWTFDYLQSLGILIGVIAVGGLLLFVTSRSRSRALSYVLAAGWACHDGRTPSRWPPNSAACSLSGRSWVRPGVVGGRDGRYPPESSSRFATRRTRGGAVARPRPRRRAVASARGVDNGLGPTCRGQEPTSELLRFDD